MIFEFSPSLGWNDDAMSPQRFYAAAVVAKSHRPTRCVHTVWFIRDSVETYILSLYVHLDRHTDTYCFDIVPYSLSHITRIEWNCGKAGERIVHENLPLQEIALLHNSFMI